VNGENDDKNISNHWFRRYDNVFPVSAIAGEAIGSIYESIMQALDRNY